MCKSNRVRLTDVRGAMNLVGECQELWADPDAWRQHLVRGLCRLTRQAVGQYVETDGPWPEAPHRPVRLLAAAGCGWRDDVARQFHLQAAARMSKAFKQMPGTSRLMAPSAVNGRAAAIGRETRLDDDWHRAWAVNALRLAAHPDEYAASVVVDRRRMVVAMLSVHQIANDPPPTVRARRVLVFTHQQIAPLMGSRLATEGQRSLAGLTPRLRQSLDRLLLGDSEKQVAAALGVTPATAHEYIGRLHLHFGVESRGELMAYFLSRRPKSKPPTRMR